MDIDTPIVFIVFNRPETTRLVFERIRQCRPSKLFIVADGPREHIDSDILKCNAVRRIVSSVEWPCEVFTDFSDVNLGCRKRVITGLDWVFSEVEEAIIIEDDCLPDVSFFYFCQELLRKYRHDGRIMHIGANCSRYDESSIPYSYYFSRYPHVWGWATWRRAWQLYDEHMRLWPDIKKMGLFDAMFCDRSVRQYRFDVFDKAFTGEIDAWSPAWVFACWVNNGLSVLPGKTLVANIGFGADATHTRGKNRTTATDAIAMDFPLKHPPCIVRDSRADGLTEKHVFRLPVFRKVVSGIKNIVGVR